MKKIILASTSPRRKEILKKIGIPFEIIPTNYEEDMTLDLPPAELVKHLSQNKAKEVTKTQKNTIIIAADTIIAFKNQILGKPKSKQDAINTLKKLSNNNHSVFTGFTIIDTETNKSISRSVETKVFFKNLSDETITNYVASGEPLDKAGSYAIQSLGAVLVDKIEGDYFNIMGLPLSVLVDSLQKEFQLNIWEII